MIILLYAAYISFAVRRGLVVPLYRSRALWLGTSAILWGVASIFLGNFEPRVSTYYGVVGLVFFLGVAVPTLLVFLVWIDRTLSTLIRLDYLRKDIVGWKKVRPLYRLGVALVFVFSLFNPSVQYLRYLSSINYVIKTISVATVLDLPIVVIVLAYASAALTVGSIRTRDLTFRNHAKWFGYAIVGLLAVLLLPNILYMLAEIWFAYCFYRMARSLVPVNKL